MAEPALAQLRENPVVIGAVRPLCLVLRGRMIGSNPDKSSEFELEPTQELKFENSIAYQNIRELFESSHSL